MHEKLTMALKVWIQQYNIMLEKWGEQRERDKASFVGAKLWGKAAAAKVQMKR